MRKNARYSGLVFVFLIFAGIISFFIIEDKVEKFSEAHPVLWAFIKLIPIAIAVAGFFLLVFWLWRRYLRDIWYYQIIPTWDDFTLWWYNDFIPFWNRFIDWMKNMKPKGK